MKPAAYIVHRAMCGETLELVKPKDYLSVEPLYKKRKWVGLPMDKDGKMFIEGYGYVDVEAANAIQSKLKELNHGH